jgi:hypothetical protein
MWWLAGSPGASPAPPPSRRARTGGCPPGKTERLALVVGSGTHQADIIVCLTSGLRWDVGAQDVDHEVGCTALVDDQQEEELIEWNRSNRHRDLVRD